MSKKDFQFDNDLQNIFTEYLKNIMVRADKFIRYSLFAFIVYTFHTIVSNTSNQNRNDIPELKTEIDIMDQLEQIVTNIDDFYDMTMEESEIFFRLKDMQYARRRNRMAEMCKYVNTIYPKPVKHNLWIDTIKFVKSSKVALCNIAKVIQTYWNNLKLYQILKLDIL